MFKYFKSKKVLLISLFLSSFITGCASKIGYSTTCYNPLQKSLSEAITTVVKKNTDDKPPIFKMRRVTPFLWDKLYIFSPYTTSEVINKTLKLKWDKIECSSIASNDSINLLVFLKDGKVVNYLEHPRNVDFEPLARNSDQNHKNIPESFSPDTAVFAITLENDRISLNLLNK